MLCYSSTVLSSIRICLTTRKARSYLLLSHMKNLRQFSHFFWCRKQVCSATELICPLCDTCSFIPLNKSCLYSKISAVFDNNFTVAYAFIMALWGKKILCLLILAFCITFRPNFEVTASCRSWTLDSNLTSCLQVFIIDTQLGRTIQLPRQLLLIAKWVLLWVLGNILPWATVALSVYFTLRKNAMKKISEAWK